MSKKEENSNFKSLKQQYGEIEEFIPAGFIVAKNNERYDIEFANNNIVKMLGYDDFEDMTKALNGQAINIVYKDDLKKINYEIKARETVKGDYITEYRALKKDGTVIWLNQSSCHMKNSQTNEELVYAYYIDITQKKQYEEQLKLYRTKENLGVYEIKLDNNFTLLYGNDRYYQIHEYTKESMQENLQNMCIKYVHADDRKRVAKVVNDALKSGLQNVEWDMRIITGRGIEKNVHTTGVFEKRNGKDILIGTVVDNTTQANLERQIIKEKERYEMILNNMPGGIARFDISDKFEITYLSDGVLKLAGYNKVDNIAVDNEKMLLAIHPDDKEEIYNNITDAINKSQTFSESFRILTKSGKYKYINLKATFIKQEDDHKVYYGIYTDIDNEKKTQQALKETNEQKENIVNSIPGGIAIFKISKKIETVYFSDGLPELMGYTVQEYGNLVKQDALSLTYYEDADYVISETKKAVKNESSIDCVFRKIHKDGSMVWVHMQGKKIGEKDGCPLVQCIFHNITKQQETEIELRKKQIMYDVAMQNTNINIWEHDFEDGIIIYTRREDNTKVTVSENRIEEVISNDKLSPESAGKLKILIDKIKNGERTAKTEIWFEPQNIRDTWCEEVTYVILEEERGKVKRALGIGKNVTEEINSKSRNEKIELALMNANIFLWDYDIKTHTIYQQQSMSSVSANVKEIIINVPESIIDAGMVRSDFIDKYRAMYKRVEQGEKSIDETICTYDKSHNELWCKCILTTIFNDDNKPVRAVGCGINVTKQILSQQKLNEEIKYQEETYSENLLAKMYFDLTKNKIEKYINTGEDKIYQENMSYDEFAEKLAETAVVKQQKEKLVKFLSRNNILKEFEANENYKTFDYQRKLDNGQIIWVNISIKTYKNVYTGDKMSFMYTYNIDDEKNMQLMIGQVAKTDYDFIAAIDVNTQKYTLFVNENTTDTAIPPFNTSTYEQEVREFANQYVIPEDKERNIREMSLKNVMDKLSDSDSYVIYVSVYSDESKIQQKKMQFSYMNEEKTKILITRTDITDIVENESRQKEALKNALVQAKEASVAKSTFLSRMSHEIRTPLNAIIGMSALAVQDINDSKKIADCISKIGISARYLLSLINDILDMSRIESGKMAIQKEKFVFDEFINNINAICYEQAAIKGIDYDSIVTSFLEDYYYGDEMKIKQILLNIIGNAIKFTPKGGKVQFIIHQEKMKDSKVKLKFIINDTGIGIKEEFIPHLFDAFEQADSGITANYGGTGLGLAISKNLTDLMNGNIYVNSIEGVGTEFIVEIPLEVDEETKRIKPNIDFNKLYALVVDNEILTCQNTKALLNEMGIKAEYAISGEKAVEQVKINYEKNKNYDVILIDWKMPEMNGIETTRKIREVVGPDVTIIIITAYDWQAIEHEAKLAGANLLMTKPLFKRNLISAFEKVYMNKDEQQHEQIKKEFDFTGKHILVVEDHLLNIEVIKRLLEAKNASVDVAENGLVAIESFTLAPLGFYDAILMDIRMPLMDGLTATKAIRHLKKKTAKTIPIIAMSANAFDEDVAKSKAAGMNDHLSKPIEPELLYATLDSYICKE